MADRGRPDYYLVLGVTRDASIDEVRAAYRRLSRSAHPDTGGTDARFRLVREAYEVLSDASARAMYDGGGPPAAVAEPRPASPPTVAEPSASPAGCVVGVVAIVGLALVIAVVIIGLVGSSDAPNANQPVSGTTVGAPVTRVDVFDRWRTENAATVAAIVANGQEIGAALSSPSGAIDLDTLREACTRRLLLLGALESSSPTPRDDVTKAVNAFVASERRAMSSCLASPPDFDRLAEWGERGRADLQTIVRATRS